MEFAFTDEQICLRDEVRSFILREAAPEVVEEVEFNNTAGPATKAFLRKLGARGWLTPTWPKRYGGLEASQFENLIIADELSYHLVRPPLVGTSMAGPTIMRFGSEELKERFLLPLARAEIEFALGYTEPQAGSDLASLDIRAVEDGDSYVITGQKVFNTASHYADYHWLGARTDPDAPKHRGVSLFIVDFKSPGINIRPLWTLAGWRTNEVFYDHVRVPKGNLVGTRGRGFHQIAVALDFERINPIGGLRRLFDDFVAYAKETKINGQPLAADPVVQRQIAEATADLEVCHLFSYRLAWILDTGRVPNYEASMGKLFTSEAGQRITHTALRILGPAAGLRRGSKWVPIEGALEYRIRREVPTTIFGGTSEIQRNIIAQRGLGLPKA